MNKSSAALSTRSLKTAAIMNFAVAVMALFGCIAGYIGDYSGGLAIFRYYTTDSNVLAMIICTVLGVQYIRQLKTGREVAKWAIVVKYCAVCVLMVTFLVTVFILTPFLVIDSSLYGLENDFTVGQAIATMLFSPCTLFHHLLCPLVSFSSLLMFDRLPFKPGKCVLFAMIPTAIYAAVSITLNILRIWHGPYPFLFVYEQSLLMSFVWFIVVFGGAGLISWIVAKLAKHE